MEAMVGTSEGRKAVSMAPRSLVIVNEIASRFETLSGQRVLPVLPFRNLNYLDGNSSVRSISIMCQSEKPMCPEWT